MPIGAKPSNCSSSGLCTLAASKLAPPKGWRAMELLSLPVWLYQGLFLGNYRHRRLFNNLPIPILDTAHHDLDIWRTVG